jgi:rhamnosyltransferase
MGKWYMTFDVCAIVTVYYPDNSILLNISELEKQVALIVITDNTPDADNTILFDQFSPKIVYVPNKKNLGLSLAFNKCLRLDAAKKADFILFMDQDSLAPDNLVKSLVDDFIFLQKKGTKIGCIGPVYYETNGEKIAIPKMRKDLYENIYAVKTIITSSMLTTYENLEKIGFWNDDIFLDLADWDLCWRFQKEGMLCCLTENVVLNHKLGKSVKKIGFCGVKEGAPVREYYQTRDCLKLLFKMYTPIKYRMRFVLMITIRPIIHLLFLSCKLRRINYIFLGVYDFLRHKNGDYAGSG